jgi:hypothetical protein
MPKGVTTGIIYVPLDVRWPRTKKVRAMIVRHKLDGMAAWALYLAMACYCRENLSDGFVPADEIGALAYPLPSDEAERLLDLLLDYRLVGRSDDSQGHSLGYGPGHSPGHSDRYSRGYLVRAYVKRNGTRADVLRMAAQLAAGGRAGANSRWSDAPDSQGHSQGHSPPHDQTETETKTETTSRARPRAHEDDDDLDELTNIAHATLTAHGPITREQTAAWVRSLLLGKTVDDPRRYVVGALRHEARKAWREATAATPIGSRQPPQRSTICRRCSRTDHPTEQCPTLESMATPGPGDGDDTARQGAADARAQLAARPRTSGPPKRDEPAELHGEQLARAQLAAARAGRGADPAPLGDEPGDDAASYVAAADDDRINPDDYPF